MAAIQIRNVPADVHARLKRKAAARGQSLSEYLLVEARRLAEQPSWEESLARLAALPPVDEGDMDGAALIRADRDGR